jgi:hypothetical protein
MAFTDLPPDWPTLPITRSDLLPDVLDLVVGDEARASGTLTLLICDRSDRLVCPIQITDIGEPGAERTSHLVTAMATAAELDPDAGVLAAVGRHGGLSVTDDDRDWADALAASAAGNVRLLGVHVVTSDGSRPVPVRVIRRSA